MNNNEIRAREGGDFGVIDDNYSVRQIQATIASRAGKAVEKVQALEQEIEEIKSAPDVVDIVATKADLDNYDMSTLTDKDVVRVLDDETEDGQSTYYRYDASTNSFVYIGAVGSYYSLAFKPIPSSVNTTGTTAQLIYSIQDLNAPAGMAYLGTVSLSDMPASLIQEEVEIYIYDNNLVYLIMRSADTAPYQWWCNSYDYRGWEPIGGGGGIPTTTTFWGQTVSGGAVQGELTVNGASSSYPFKVGGTYLTAADYRVTRASSSGLVIYAPKFTVAANGNERLKLDSSSNRISGKPLRMTFSSNPTAIGEQIKQMADPTDAQDAATKNYVDTAVASAGAPAFPTSTFETILAGA